MSNGRKWLWSVAAIAVLVAAIAVALHSHSRRQARIEGAKEYLNRVSGVRLGDQYEIAGIFDDADQNVLNPWWVLYSGRVHPNTAWAGSVEFTLEPVQLQAVRWPCRFPSGYWSKSLGDPSEMVLTGRVGGTTVVSAIIVAVSTSDDRAWVCVVYGDG